MKPETANNLYNLLEAQIGVSLAQVNTALPVRVVAVDTARQRVKAQPLVHQLGRDGRGHAHAPVSDLPYVRLQGGEYAIICDPEVGDIGLVVFCSRDISKVKATRGLAPPDTRRRHSFSDGVYIGGCLNAEPKVVIKLSKEGVEISAPKVTIRSDVRVEGKLEATGDVKAGNISLQNHVHISNAKGSPTGKPQ